MTRAGAFLPAALFLLGTLAPKDDGLASAVRDHAQHPGLGHPEEGEGDHHHGDPDDHHETPDSPCHHHDAHTCCSSGTVLGMPGASASFDTPQFGFLAIPCVEPRHQPTVRELFHVPLA